MRKARYLHLILLFVLFDSCSHKTRKNARQPYEANWESIKTHETPAWYKDAKFGIFIHWGPYCVPEYGSEWYPRLMYMDENVIDPNNKIQSKGPSDVYRYHVKNWGTLDEFGYKDFIPLFRGEKFDAEEWMDLFKRAGAKYVVPVAEHHDGFAMYNSSFTKWNAVKMGPKRDVLGELAKASKKYGLKIGASSHYAFNWNYYEHKEGFDTMNPEYFDLYGRPHDSSAEPDQVFLDNWWKRTTEIIDKYQLDLLWFDFYWDRSTFTEYHPKLAAHFYNNGASRNAEVVLQSKNYKYESFPVGTAVMDIERGKSSEIRKDPWQTDTSIGRNSWGCVFDWESKSPNQLVDDLIDIVSKNGCLLLNVGPKKDGTIPEAQKEVLLEIGSWLDVNGEAIYATHPWQIYGEGSTKEKAGPMTETSIVYSFDDIRFTMNGNNLYAISMEWPDGETFSIKSLGLDSQLLDKDITSIHLLGLEQELIWQQLEDELIVILPNSRPTPFAHAFKITLE